MAKATKKKSTSTKNFVPMKRTRAMLSEVWDQWRNTLGHTPDAAKRMMTTAIKEMHKLEVVALKKSTKKERAVKKTAKKMVVKKAKAIKRKIK